ncbi:MAG: tRNA (adenosine(37)-N6)-threonylcarbamoyltransferase complex ATPase subunit type 1 TsaE [Candidatus Gracilibacteria bacterium]
MKKTTQSAAETMDLAKLLYEEYPEHKIWLLYGDLGTGKTTLIKGLGEALGLGSDLIKSPTYTLVSEYAPLVHYDLYRIEEMDDLTRELLHEHMESGKHIVIEWPEKIESEVITSHLKIYLTHGGGDVRKVQIMQFRSHRRTLSSLS